MRRKSPLAVYALSGSVVLGGLMATSHGVRDRTPPVGGVVASPAVAPSPSGLPSTEGIVRTAPFRSDRKPPEMTYAEALARDGSVEPAATDAVTRPAWQLTGILWSASPLALFDGVSGDQRTRLAGVGDLMDDFQIMEIGPLQVTVSHGDSTWTYHLAAPWT